MPPGRLGGIVLAGSEPVALWREVHAVRGAFLSGCFGEYSVQCRVVVRCHIVVYGVF